jgi:hypothetical protein
MGQTIMVFFIDDVERLKRIAAARATPKNNYFFERGAREYVYD